ncbi:uracil phosphoribosyltransferase [Antarcticibacterium arcticum]|uniref:Uracil phosphoribosyltransferase n=1 Tax=Antarcticibacterium arcticum TaxID=2585771 RepID=A0A5B8YR22_9FLAO|nr:uracil phosphoribosyltransferase [Antarcticibacterium arcticum]QED38479.1 uracil phosphoribosyltransferase [Antarcticibacterium arcticum]
MKDFFEGIAWLFEEILFLPFNMLRELELSSWFLANILNWIFVIIAFAAFIFWMLQLKKFNENDEENRDPTAHSFLG